MRIAILAIITSVAFAGCSDPLPAGDAASTGHALAVAGGLAAFESQGFVATAPPPASETEPCPADQVPVPPEDIPDPVETQRCQRPYTKFTVNFTTLPDPSGGSYSLGFYNEASAATAPLGDVSGHVHPTTGAFMADEVVFDNEQECSTATSDEGCDMTVTYDTVLLYLDDIVVAKAPLSGGSGFMLDEGLLGASFSAAYEGKDLTLQVSGLGNYTYEGWLITVDDAGVATHAESFPVSNGENVYTAEMNVDEYSAVHIHVAGTKLNVAVGSLA